MALDFDFNACYCNIYLLFINIGMDTSTGSIHYTFAESKQNYYIYMHIGP